MSLVEKVVRLALRLTVRSDIVNVLSLRTFFHTFTISNCEQIFENNSQLLYTGTGAKTSDENSSYATINTTGFRHGQWPGGLFLQRRRNENWQDDTLEKCDYFLPFL